MSEIKSPLFQRTVNCPSCKGIYKTTAVLSSKIRKIKTYSDFYVEYKGANPNYYLVHVCPVCGYAYFKKSKQLSAEHKRIIKEKITKNFNSRDFTGARDANAAIDAYKLALLCGQLVGEEDNIIAAILMQIVWLYRELGDYENELRFMQLTYNTYKNIYDNATFEVNVPRVLYILGELCRQLKDYKGALKWYSRIIEDKKIRDPSIIKMAREQFAEVRHLQKIPASR
ncbi:hypothetical protein GGQ84_000384 [Desulfitispora alkaliphila]|uniref:DUF2225 domain-containing protein n=1 Tax=Desulfitispora alkaliphila TaxID=622674 RepID=UPI003D23DD9D